MFVSLHDSNYGSVVRIVVGHSNIIHHLATLHNFCPTSIVEFLYLSRQNNYVSAKIGMVLNANYCMHDERT